MRDIRELGPHSGNGVGESTRAPDQELPGPGTSMVVHVLFRPDLP